MTDSVCVWRYNVTKGDALEISFMEVFIMGFKIENGVLKKYEEEKGVTEIVIPDIVTSIGDEAFLWCKNLTSITIPDSVTSIGYKAFGCCYNLTSITIPNSVTSIGSEAFYGCKNLTNITIPDSVTSIG